MNLQWLRRFKRRAQWSSASLAMPGSQALALAQPPLRAALFTADQMRQHGRVLAARHRLSERPQRDSLLQRLQANHAVLVEVGRMLAVAMAAGRNTTPAGDWLLDNLYLIEQEIATAKRHLPPGYSRELPRLGDDAALYGAAAQQPRIYDLALNAVAHGDGRLVLHTLSLFLSAYQELKPLTLGELWAFPIMLRLALIENLRRIAVAVATSQRSRDAAEKWAERMLQAAEAAPSELILVVADLSRSGEQLDTPFVAALTRRLQGRGAAMAVPLTWLEQRLVSQGHSAEQMFSEDSRAQVEWQLSVANSIASLRLLGGADWPSFVEDASGVEARLREDPAQVYARMDFASRDAYRHAVEGLARRAGVAETEIAQRVVNLAAAAAEPPASDSAGGPVDLRWRHVGYYLVAAGRRDFERLLGLRASMSSRGALRAHVAAVSLATLAMTAGGAGLAWRATQPAQLPLWLWLAFVASLTLATSQLAMAVVNWLATLLVPPRTLPRLDTRNGLPTATATLVVVPTLLTRIDSIDALVDALEVHYLANRDDQLRFALLTDLRDSEDEHRDDDQMLVERAAAGIAALNARHGTIGDDDDRFFLLHRPRQYSEPDRIWMGRERKRGKLADLNALLRARARVGPGEAFARVEGDVRALQDVCYVITLDTDTELPQQSAAQMVAAMAHPLQRPRFGSGARSGCVVEGHAILQPRTKASLPSALRSRYARLFAADAGIDPYTQAVSDVYQDLFDEGSYVGKGIYDVDAFERALAGRLPDGRILSHDLIEGCHARAGLISDVALYEQAPSRHAAETARMHRWTRGDWQLLPWLFRRIRVLPGAPLNPLSALSRLKLLDNLRRSLVAPALLVLLLLAWLWLPAPGAWTLAVVAIVGLVPLLVHAAAFARKTWEGATGGWSEWRTPLLNLLFRLMLLPDDARLQLDAIVRTLWRLSVSHRRLLEWTASAELPAGAAPSSGAALRHDIRDLWAAPALALVVLAVLWALRPAALGAASPLIVLWALAPLIVWWFDQPPATPAVELSDDDRSLLRRTARRTWAFFEAHSHADDHYLVPDNVQFEPVMRIAHRTSPTNLGFALLAPVAAHDLGFVLLPQLLQRLQRQLDTLQTLPRYRGHFYNWYDTRSLDVLSPRYVSSVDSGNLFAALLVLRGALLELADEPIIDGRCFESMGDALALHREAAPSAVNSDSAAALQDTLQRCCAAPPQTLRAWRAALQTLRAQIDEWSRAGERVAAQASPLQDATGAARATDAQRWALALQTQCADALALLDTLMPAGQPEIDDRALPTLRSLSIAEPASSTASALWQQIEALASRALELTQADYDFLYDKARRLMSIGWHVDDGQRDPGNYDLLASEARLGVYIAIAQGQLPASAWFALGRGLSSVDGRPVLLSWSGSMFEYLMPALLMPSFEGTLLAQSYRTAVRRQIEYGSERGAPWGISESGFSATDRDLNYQYRAFGVPGLGLKRGLGDELVVAPYATMMALIVEPAQATANLRTLAAMGAVGAFGFFEALDFTPARLPPDQPYAIVRSFMAHHQGMALLGLSQALVGERMQQRFAADASLRASLPLLHERASNRRGAATGSADRAALHPMRSDAAAHERRFERADTPTPEVQLLSNGRYHLMLTQAGGSSSRWQDLALTRWHEDTTEDSWGSHCYLRDLENHKLWSAAYLPTRAEPKHYEVVFSEGRAEFKRIDYGIETHMTLAVSPEDDIELRRVRLRNTTGQARLMELTSYAEVVLASAAADAQHPAFSKLFVQTEVLLREGAVLAWRRPRAAGESTPWMFHLLSVHEPDSTLASLIEVSHETDRARFIGRNRSVADPLALQGMGPLSNTAGAVLDPVMASRCVLTIDADRWRTVDLVTGVAASRDDCLALIGKYRDRRLADRVFELAWTHAQVMLRQLEINAEDAQNYARIAGMLIYSQPTLRAETALIRQNRRSQPDLWGYSISGDLPIVLLSIADHRHIDLVRQLVQAHGWWRHKGLTVDLVIWNEERDTYRQRLHEQILGIVGAGREAANLDRPGGIFVRHADQLAPEDRILLRAVARVIFNDSHGSLAEQIQQGRWRERRQRQAPLQAGSVDRRRRPLMGRIAGPTAIPATSDAATQRDRSRLTMDNGVGGFDDDARQYVITATQRDPTPLPWSNVLANPRLGCVLSNSGSVYTWFGNAHEYRLTPWHNDPVGDSCGEALYLRDEDSGAFWSPSGWPSAAANVVVRHGFGFSRFEQQAFGIDSRLTLFVATDAPVRFALLELRNSGNATRRLSATAYVEWVLGSRRASNAPHIVTERQPDSGALLARNSFGAEHAACVAFLDVDVEYQPLSTFTCHRGDFIGRNRSLRDPVAMHENRLSRRLGAALDPCAAIQSPITLGAGESRTICFRLGAGETMQEAVQLIERFRTPDAAASALQQVEAHWRDLLGAVQVQTPDPALNALVNGWLPYQVTACRLWARSGYYQSGGAYGFRDQLQDAMALVHHRPALLREQLLRCAGRQFLQGDVQHWWHPPGGQGVRSTCSDDYLWLPLALARYWRSTGDRAVLDEQVAFIEGRPVPPGDESYYDRPQQANQSATLYEHARLAVEHGLRYGAHGLPLMGSGDWNDGMNRVGHEGRGESVWLAFFLYTVLQDFAALAAAHGDAAFAQRCADERASLTRHIEAHAWDGDWYRRAWFDDGTPLGSASNSECRIDLIAQSWSVLSGVAPSARAARALQSMVEQLVDGEHRIVRLLAPPFNGAGPDPGYIAGYLPGVRENGGQYTHGAVWAAMALAAAGEVQHAWDLFDMINPLQHARSEALVQRYKVEPYVVSADVYSVDPHAGRGGWTWYTGSAGWMFRLIVESLLGIVLEHDADGASLQLAPRLPAAWSGFEFTYRRGDAQWHVVVQTGVADALGLELDGQRLPGRRLPLAEDGAVHEVRLTLD